MMFSHYLTSILFMFYCLKFLRVKVRDDWQRNTLLSIVFYEASSIFFFILAFENIIGFPGWLLLPVTAVLVVWTGRPWEIIGHPAYPYSIQEETLSQGNNVDSNKGRHMASYFVFFISVYECRHVNTHVHALHIYTLLYPTYTHKIIAIFV